MDGHHGEQEAREHLFRVLTEFPVLYRARQGVGTKLINPFESLQSVVRAYVNPLILIMNDLVQEIQSGLPYLEALDRLVLFSLRYPYRDRIGEAVDQLARIEGDRPYFLWGLAALQGEALDLTSRAKRLKEFHRRLHLMNRYYTQRFKIQDSTDLIPWRASFRTQADGMTEGTYEFPTRRQLDTFRNAILCLEDLLREKQGKGWSPRALGDRIQSEIKELALLLFDYGYTVEEICGKIRREDSRLPALLNSLLLSELEGIPLVATDPVSVSRHLIRLSLLDYCSVVPFRTFYCRPSRSKEAMALAKKVERRLGEEGSSYRRLLELYQRYKSAQSSLLAYYLEYRFTRAHGDYMPARDRQHFGVDMTRKFFFRYFDQSSVQRQASEEASKRLYSSKNSQEIVELLQLIISALTRPDMLKGKELQILGHIRSGAMGRILLGIHRANIVALKEAVVAPGSRMPLSEKVRQLEYEARIHLHVQSGHGQHENIVECFGIVEEQGHRFLAIGYHPAETLGSIISRVRAFISGGSRASPGFPLTIGEFAVVSTQLLKALLHLRERRVVHRDIKPANVLYLVDEAGRAGLIKLIDFGVALGLAEGLPKDMFRRQVVGTMAYMAPEAVMAESSYASDLYSVGVILYQIMSGKLPLNLRRPKSRDDLKMELKRVVSERRNRLVEDNPKLLGDSTLESLAQLVQSMIETDPTRRPPVDILLSYWKEALDGFSPQDLEMPFPYL